MGAGRLSAAVVRRAAERWGAVLVAVCSISCGELSRDSATTAAPTRGREVVARPARPSEPERPSPREAFFDVHGDTLSTPDHGHIRLGPGHASVDARTRIRLSPSGLRVIVATNRGPCGPGSTHVVDSVELATRAVHRMREGAGWVRVSFDGDVGQVEPHACD